MRRLDTDVVVVGGGLGGVAAALAVLRAGRRVILTEQYAWLGGQLTSQAVTLDEHTWIEQFGCTASYRELRDGIRRYYRDNYPLSAEAAAQRYLNPGAGLVSRLCSEPKVAVAVIDELLGPFISAGRLVVLQPAVPVGAHVDGDVVTSVEVATQDERIELRGDYVLDATETGELLPLTGTEYVVGSESREDTGEPNAPAVADPGNVQAISWCFVVDHVEGDHTIPRPDDYDYWATFAPEFWGAPMIGLTGPHPRTLETVTRDFTPNIDDDPFSRIADQRADGGDQELWTFRRLLARKVLEPGFLDSDIVLVNWPMIDYVGGSIIDSPDAESHLDAARRQSRAMLYWLQTEAPRPDGGRGWPGLRLRPDVTGTDDGFAQAPYIRESRRIRAEYTVVEQDLSIGARGSDSPATFSDSVGVGMYRIDLHPSTGGDNYIDIASVPFEIPLGALIPIRMRNLLPAAKNVGTTHITNGAFRLHPVEWSIGEAAGWLAAFCLDRATDPRAVHHTPSLLEEFQTRLVGNGVELHWPDVAGY
ncbi:FAD-dependent oxidoreductase [Humibacter sp. RRB41]|uniref:FAD-dependent oxidoreductase n=1 Tax=Humibacter sp. RRB41 TaxID=2919946 RepID=UPI001FAA6707|nr:FAD-dependent oxidoreductase [Humibacter sp. RRB41]